MADDKKEPAPPFALDLSECQVLWEAYATTNKLPSQATKVGDDLNATNLHGAWIDGFMHSRGWRFDPHKPPKTYSEIKAYEMHPNPLWALEAIRNHLNVVNDPQQIINAVRELSAAFSVLERAATDMRTKIEAPIPMLLWCPECQERHIDVAFANKPHKDHSCQHCGMTWRPAKVYTVGVQFLPGYKDLP